MFCLAKDDERSVLFVCLFGFQTILNIFFLATLRRRSNSKCIQMKKTNNNHPQQAHQQRQQARI